MAVCTALNVPAATMVGMGQVVVAAEPARLTAVLGSCIGLALHHPRLRLGALSHIVLPDSAGRDAPPGKFADAAIPYMVRQLEQVGANHSGVVAKIAGGACMFGTSGPLQIGDANVEAVKRALAAAGVRLVAQDVGGGKGRRIVFHTESGELIVEIIGQAQRVL